MRALGGSSPVVLALVICGCMRGAARMAAGAVGLVDVCGAGVLVDVSLPVFIWNISAIFSSASVCHPWHTFSARNF